MRKFLSMSDFKLFCVGMTTMTNVCLHTVKQKIAANGFRETVVIDFKYVKVDRIWNEVASNKAKEIPYKRNLRYFGRLVLFASTFNEEL